MFNVLSMMSNYTVEMADDAGTNFHVQFDGPKDSNFFLFFLYF